MRKTELRATPPRTTPHDTTPHRLTTPHPTPPHPSCPSFLSTLHVNPSCPSFCPIPLAHPSCPSLLSIPPVHPSCAYLLSIPPVYPFVLLWVAMAAFVQHPSGMDSYGQPWPTTLRSSTTNSSLCCKVCFLFASVHLDAGPLTCCYRAQCKRPPLAYSWLRYCCRA